MNEGNRFKLIEIIFNKIELTRTQKDKIAVYLGKCEDTGVNCIPEAHRVIRGNEGGTYVLNNIKWVSRERHKEYHCMEKGGKK